MKTMSEIKALVAESIGGAFGGYPVVLQESPEDSTSLWVQVFAVPADTAEVVTDAILDLQGEVFAVSDVILLPMVKNLAVTREHYPQYAPRDPAATAARLGLRYAPAVPRPVPVVAEGKVRYGKA